MRAGSDGFSAPSHGLLPAPTIALSRAEHLEHRLTARTPSDPAWAEPVAWFHGQHESQERMLLVAELESHDDRPSAGVPG
jgi:hypothetical protein